MIDAVLPMLPFAQADNLRGTVGAGAGADRRASGALRPL